MYGVEDETIMIILYIELFGDLLIIINCSFSYHSQIVFASGLSKVTEIVLTS